MDYRQKIIDSINRFYVESTEEFREAEARIANDSRFRRIFKKKDYSGNIEMLKRCKSAAGNISFPESEIPSSDRESRAIVDKCKESIRRFRKLCDSYVSMQVSLDKKAKGAELTYKEYKKFYNQAKEDHAVLNMSLKELDILYADYIDNNGTSEPESGEYMTYDMLAGGKGKQ